MTDIANTETMNDMPWTRDQLTREQFDAWLASRKEAGRVIDIETCELGKWAAYDCDVYGALDLPPEMRQIGTNRYVRSPTSNGWINEEDLPIEKFCAMYDRIKRVYRLWEAASAAWHADPRIGGCENSSPETLIEWFKVNYAAQASEAESGIRREVEIERAKLNDENEKRRRSV
jgi:hypothetical protein